MEKELSSGERAAETKGLDITTFPQFTTLYLKAKDLLECAEDNKHISHPSHREKIKMERWNSLINGDFRKASVTNLANAINIKLGTATRVISKFKLLLQGEEETFSEHLYPKIIEAFERLETMLASEIWQIASDAINDHSFGDEDLDMSAFRVLTPKETSNIEEITERFKRFYKSKDIMNTFSNLYKTYVSKRINHGQTKIKLTNDKFYETMPYIIDKIIPAEVFYAWWETYTEKVEPIN